MANAAASVTLAPSSPQFSKKLSSSASTLQSDGGCYRANIETLGKRFDRQLTLGTLPSISIHQSDWN